MGFLFPVNLLLLVMILCKEPPPPHLPPKKKTGLHYGVVQVVNALEGSSVLLFDLIPKFSHKQSIGPYYFDTLIVGVSVKNDRDCDKRT